ncbi:MAG: hypothetical protein KDA84_06610, partial [Planctomycetaceae bacterium]|nr:hypothetical protein [Planctomycetaceae bacterium]
QNPHLPRLANWLAGQRQHGQYWRSTRDSALAVHALADYLLKFQETKVEYPLSVLLDGGSVKEAKVSWRNMLDMTNRIRVDGSHLKPGRHRITLEKKKPGPLFYSMTAQYVFKPKRILAEGNGMKIKRRYFKLPSRTLSKTTDSNNQQRTELTDGDSITIGDTVEVELTITADEDYDFVAFEDPKPAGCEPLQLRSGSTWGDGLCTNLELRDENVTFFVSWLSKGTHKLRYKLRTEMTGTFHVLPTKGFAMYAPEIHTRSAEVVFRILDRTAVGESNSNEQN